MREINIQIEKEYVKGAGVPVGAALSGRDVCLKATFSRDWEGLSLEAQWRNAKGGDPINDVLATESAPVDGEREYTVIVPFAAKKYAGTCSVTFRGYTLSGAAETEAQGLSVTVSDSDAVKSYIYAYGAGGKAELIYDGMSAWRLNGEGDAVDLTSAGITVTGTPAENNKITLKIKTSEVKMSAYAEFTVSESAWRQDAPDVDPTAEERLADKMSELADDLSSVEGSLSAHAQDENNPHGVTAAQTGAYCDGNEPPYPVTSVASKTGDITLSKSDVGLSLVDNTSDQNKPVSAAQRAELDKKLDKEGDELNVKGALSLLGSLYISDPETGGNPVLVLDGSGTASGIIRLAAAQGSRLLLSDDIENPVRLCGIAAPQNDDEAANKEYVDGSFNAAEAYADGKAASVEQTAKAYADDLAHDLEGGKIDKADGEATGLLRAENETVEGRLAIQNESGNGGMLRGYTSSASRGLMLRVIEAGDTRPLTNSSGKEVLNARKDSFNFLVPIYISSSVSGYIGIGMGGKRITSLGDPQAATDAVTRQFVDENFVSQSGFEDDVGHIVERELEGLFQRISDLEYAVSRIQEEATARGWNVE